MTKSTMTTHTRRYVSISRDESMPQICNLFVYLRPAGGGRTLLQWQPLFVSSWSNRELDEVLTELGVTRSAPWEYTETGALAWIKTDAETLARLEVLISVAATLDAGSDAR